MISPPKTPAAIQPRRIVVVSAAAALAGGAVALVCGHSSGLPAPLAGMLGLRTLSAVCFILCGAALGLSQLPGRPWQWLARLCAAAVAGLSAAVLSELARKWAALGPDQLFLSAGDLLPARLTPNSAICFLFVSTGIFLMAVQAAARWRPVALSWLGSAVVAVAVFAGLGHAAGRVTGYGWWHLSATAIFTSPLFLLLGITLLTEAWREREVRWMIGPWVTVGFAAGLALLVAVAAFSHRSLRNLAESADRANRSYEILVKLADIRGNLPASGGTVTAGPEIPAQLAELHRLTEDNPLRQREIEELSRQIAAHLLDAEAVRGRIRALENAEQEEVRGIAAREDRLSHGAFSMLPTSAVLSMILLLRGLFWVNCEMTVRQRGENALRQSEERFRTIFNDASMPMCICTTEGRFAQANPAFCKMTGYPEDELLGLTVVDVTHPEERITRASEPLEKLLSGEIPSFSGEKRYIRRDGSVVWAEVNVSIVRAATGRPVFLIAQVHDITASKMGAEALRKSEEERALAIKAGQLGIWSWDQQTLDFIWSERCNLMAGQPPDATPTYIEVIGFIHPDERARVHAEATAALERKEEIDLEYRTVWPDGTVRWIHARGRGFEDAEGELVRITGIMQDVTERRESEEALRNFNTVLESMVVERTEVIQLTMMELREEIARRRQLEEEILGIGERAQARIGQDLHDDLGQQLVGIAIHLQLLATRLAADEHPSAQDATRLKAFLADTISTTRNLAKSLYPVELERGGLLLSLQDLAHRTELLAGITCTVTADDAFTYEQAAEIHLYRIVQESIGNALKHGHARHIDIACESRGGISTLTVTDDGTGFEPPADGEALGMGLHLFQYRARLIGAEITVARGETGGCVVSCVLRKTSPATT